MTTRDELRNSGAAIRARLGFSANSAETEPAPDLARLSEESVWGAIWARPGLALEDRMLAVLSALTTQQHLPQLRRYIGAALHIGVPARGIQEIFIQCGLYSGFPTILNALALAKEVFAEQGVTVPDTKMPNLDADALMAQGRETMAQIHGGRAQQGYAAPGNTATAALYETATAHGYGDIWNRPDLDHRQRMICALAAFTAIDQVSQLVKFASSARNTGLSHEEVIEIIMQTAPYTGFPRALNALAAIGDDR